MTGKQFPVRGRRWRAWLASAALLAASWSGGAALAQTDEAAAPAAPPAFTVDGGVVQAGCATCGGGAAGGTVGGGCSSCGGCGGCVPGRDNEFCCCGWAADTACGRFLSDVYQCICCPDPCYEPKWTPVSDAAFFVDAPRPITQMRLIYEHGFDVHDPDRAEFFWARERTDPSQATIGGVSNGVGKGVNAVVNRVNYDAFDYYMEGATGRIGVFVQTSYLSLDPEASPFSFLDLAHSAPGDLVPRTSGGAAGHASGFGDMTVGTKTLLLDCPILQLSLEFKTYIPTGAFTKGLGTGHVSLEPSLLLGLSLTPTCYVQTQTSLWIPLGGDPDYEGNVLHTHVSLNKVLCAPCPGLQVVGTAEMNNWWVLNGEYTAPGAVVVAGSGLAPLAASARMDDIFTVGPGVRLFVCDKIDVGVGASFALGGNRWADELLRAEFRWRF
ncbi:MAG TPA: transporter [Gemmataceae bacterium]|nr:transporter [Gemmataceae bacterium]